MILSNQILCWKCGDRPYSAHVHDFKHCECGAIAVDGGMSYLRRLGNPEDIEELSIVISDSDAELLLAAIEDPTKNSLGKLCNLVRVLRDTMSINIGAKE